MVWSFPALPRVVQGEIRFAPEMLEALAREVVMRETRPSGRKSKARKWLDVQAGTTWDQIVMTFNNTDAVTIQAPGIPHVETLTYDDVGFWDDRTSDPAADIFTPDAYWRHFLRYAYLYIPDEQVPKAVWAGDETDQIDHVKTWAYHINQRLNAVVHGIAPTPPPIAGKRGVYVANFRLVQGRFFRAGYSDAAGWHWSDLTGYTTTRTCGWSPTVARTYTLVVYAREAGHTAAYDAYAAVCYRVTSR